jgi:hypothetical protein
MSEQIATLVGAPVDLVASCMGELAAAGVWSTTPEGVIYSRRMVRDERRHERDRANGRLGGNPTLIPGDNPVNPTPPPPDKGEDKAQRP